MKHIAFDLNQPNPWENRAELHKSSFVYTLGSMLAFFLCSLGLTLCTRRWSAVALIVISVLYVGWIVRRPAVKIGFLLTAALLCVLGSNMLVGALFLSIVVGCMSGAFLMTTRRVPILVTLLLPIAAAGVSFAMTRRLDWSLVALMFVPASICLAVATCKDCLRTSAIIACTGGFLLVIAGCVVYGIWRTTGAIDRASVIRFVDTVREAIINYFVAQREAAIQQFSQQAAGAPIAEMYAQLDPETIRLMVVQLFHTLPALITVACTIMAFFSQMVLTASYDTVGMGKVVTPRSRILTVSLTGAVLFVVSFVLILLLSSSLALEVATNLAIMLLPIFFLCGVQSGIAVARSSPGSRLLIFFIVGALVCFYSSGMLYVVALYGAYSRISASIVHKLMNRTDSGSGDS